MFALLILKLNIENIDSQIGSYFRFSR